MDFWRFRVGFWVLGFEVGAILWIPHGAATPPGHRLSETSLGYNFTPLFADGFKPGRGQHEPMRGGIGLRKETWPHGEREGGRKREREKT